MRLTRGCEISLEELIRRKCLKKMILETLGWLIEVEVCG